MSCYTPLITYCYENPRTKKKELSYFQPSTARNRQLILNECSADGVRSYPLEIPCGKCVGCRLDKSRDWAERIMCELKYSSDNYFVTFTYDDDHLPIKNGVPTLQKREFSNFLKRLRSYYKYHYDVEFRFFVAGEYGEKYQRPHYHVIFFGLPIRDKVPYTRDLYGSEELAAQWKYGFVSVGDVTFQSAAYVARYVLKKLKSDSEEYKVREPEFVNMSRNPGIGREYFEDHHKEIYMTDNIPMRVGKKAVFLKPAKYFDRLYDLREPEDLKRIKEIRSILGKSAMQSKMEQTNMDIDQIRENDMVNKLKSIKLLRREFEEVD